MTEKKVKLQNAVALVFNTHGWGNRKQVDKDNVDAKDTDKNLLSITKRLIDPNGEVKDIEKLMYSETRNWVKQNSMPSFFQDGTYLFHNSKATEVENFLLGQSKKMADLVEKFLKVYPQRIQEVQKRLGKNFNREDYPSAGYLRRRYRFTWYWVKFDIPDDVPKEIYEAEKKRREEMWDNSAEMIMLTLRGAFKELIDHAVDCLKVDKEGKTKKFKNSSFENISEFIDAFKTKNLTNDVELQKLIDKAKKVLVDIDDPQELKKDAEFRKSVQKSFTNLTKELDKLVETKPSRKFDFEE